MEAQTDYLSHMKWQEGKVENNMIQQQFYLANGTFGGYLKLDEICSPLAEVYQNMSISILTLWLGLQSRI